MAPRKPKAKATPVSVIKSSPPKKNGSKKATAKMQEPPFPLYDDVEEANFDEGWASVVALLKGKKNIAVLTGAGISVSCGIPDFRSKEGLYATLNAEELGLSCAEELFDAHFFHEDPGPFYSFARQLYFPLGTGDDGTVPKRARPSDAHKLLALLEQHKMLLRVYSQNIDGLETEAGVSAKKVCYAHGSLQWATCCQCKRRVSSREIENDILNGTVARCQAPLATKTTIASREPSARCAASRKRSRFATENARNFVGSNGEAVCGGVMKPGVTFFGEALQNTVKTKLESDRDKVDALIVIGTSLSVAPISKVIDFLPANIPRILINRTIVHPPEQCEDDDDSDSDDDEKEFRESYVFDAYLLGFCDDVARALGKRLFSLDDGVKSETVDRGELLATVLENRDENKDDDDDGDDGQDDSSYCAGDWIGVEVPKERVFLFPGAQAPAEIGAEEASYQEIAHCDGCSHRIAGTIHKCVTCFDYDLCQKCFPILSKSHFDGEHNFTMETAAPVRSRSP